MTAPRWEAPREQTRLRKLAAEFLLVIPLIVPAAALGLFLKWTILDQTGSRQQFVGLYKAVLFRSDSVLFLMLLPASFVAISRVLGLRLASVVLGLFSLLVTVLFTLQLQSVAVLGRPTSLTTMVEGATFITMTGDWRDIAGYLDGRVAAGEALLLGAILVWSSVLATRGPRMRAALTRSRLTGVCAAIVAAGCLAGVLGASLVRRSPPTGCRCTTNILSWAAGSLIGPADRPIHDFDNMNADQLLREYRELTRTTPGTRSPEFWGAAKGYDVIFLVLETAPAELFDLGGNLDAYPGLKRLRAHAFVGLNHYSAAPASNRSYFSIFTSWYPVNSSKDFIQLNRSAVVPGVMKTLAAAGYSSPFVFNSPAAGFTPLDDDRLQSYGFEMVSSPTALTNAGWRRKFESDRLALASLLSQIEDRVAKQQHFAAGLFPQVSHGPWPDVTDGGIPASNVMARGRALMDLQDQLIVELLDRLDAMHRLDRTIIVLTGDHGLRTLTEDPRFNVGRLDARTFQVPLLISVPGVLPEPRPVTALTSHIDLVPSILDLLAIESGRDLEQGVPVWDPRLARRRAFFWGKWFLGADGYAEDGRFQMVAQDTGDVFSGSAMRFTDADRVPQDSAVRFEVRQTIDRMEQLMRVWNTRLALPASQHTSPPVSPVPVR